VTDDTWLADLVVAAAQWVLDATGLVAMPTLGYYIAASSGAADELEYYGGEL
jgi:hypothetical protein